MGLLLVNQATTSHTIMRWLFHYSYVTAKVDYDFKAEKCVFSIFRYFRIIWNRIKNIVFMLLHPTYWWIERWMGGWMDRLRSGETKRNQHVCWFTSQMPVLEWVQKWELNLDIPCEWCRSHHLSQLPNASQNVHQKETGRGNRNRTQTVETTQRYLNLLAKYLTQYWSMSGNIELINTC